MIILCANFSSESQRIAPSRCHGSDKEDEEASHGVVTRKKRKNVVVASAVQYVLYRIVLLLHDVVLRRVSYKYQLTICD
jgi:hypothetical protein